MEFYEEALGRASLDDGARKSVVHDRHGKPGFVVSPELAAWLTAHNIKSTHLSLSDERDYVVAFVVMEQA